MKSMSPLVLGGVHLSNQAFQEVLEALVLHDDPADQDVPLVLVILFLLINHLYQMILVSLECPLDLEVPEDLMDQSLLVDLAFLVVHPYLVLPIMDRTLLEFHDAR
jgi:hypothetical protein